VTSTEDKQPADPTASPTGSPSKPITVVGDVCVDKAELEVPYAQFWCARLSLSYLVDASSTMLIARSTCSEPGGVFGNGEIEARASKSASRIRFGLVTQMVVVILPDWVKPGVLSEGMSMCRKGATRGGWEQRAETDMCRNLGDPFEWVKTQLSGRMHKALGARSEVGRVHSSVEGSNDPGAKGRGHGSAADKAWSSA